jgi:hypothetical protein
LAKHLSVWANGASIGSAKSEISDLVLALQERAPWPIARRYVGDAGIEAGLGWQQALDELSYLEDLTKIDVDSLYQNYLAHVCCGEKSVRRFLLPAKLADTIRGALKSRGDIARLRRPRLKPALRRQKTSDPELVCVHRQAGGTYAIFSSIRSYEERHELKDDQIPQEARVAFEGYDEIIAITSVRYEAYSTIWVPDKRNIAEVSVDAFVDQSVHGVNDFHERMYIQLHKLTGATAVFSASNIFGAIKGIYDATAEGILSDLSFATTTGSIKHEKMRSHESLRQERYHVGGVEALATEIEPFRLGVFWRRQEPVTKEVTTPELHLVGTLAMLGSATPQLFTAGISRASGFDDFSFVRGKLDEYS